MEKMARARSGCGKSRLKGMFRFNTGSRRISYYFICYSVSTVQKYASIYNIVAFELCCP